MVFIKYEKVDDHYGDVTLINRIPESLSNEELKTGLQFNRLPQLDNNKLKDGYIPKLRVNLVDSQLYWYYVPTYTELQKDFASLLLDFAEGSMKK